MVQRILVTGRFLMGEWPGSGTNFIIRNEPIFIIGILWRLAHTPSGSLLASEMSGDEPEIRLHLFNT